MKMLSNKILSKIMLVGLILKLDDTRDGVSLLRRREVSVWNGVLL